MIAGRVRLECTCGQEWVMNIPDHVARDLAGQESTEEMTGEAETLESKGVERADK